MRIILVLLAVTSLGFFGCGGGSIDKGSIKLVDSAPPIIKLNDGNNCSTEEYRKSDLFLVVDDDFVDSKGVVFDNFDEGIGWASVEVVFSFIENQQEFVVSVTEMMARTGRYLATYSICDSSGNVGENSRFVYVLDRTKDNDKDKISNKAEVHGVPMPHVLFEFYKSIGEIPVEDLPEQHLIRTNPLFTDSDDDGLSDYVEIYKTFTHPLIEDTDKDGLSDGLEVLRIKTNPLCVDTDGDQVSDGKELNDRTDPNDKYSMKIQVENPSENYEVDEDCLY